MIEPQKLRYALVGLRIGQLLDISGVSNDWHQDDDAPFVFQLLTALKNDFSCCVQSPDLRKEVRRIIDDLSVAWNERAVIEETEGYGRPIELLHAGLLRLSKFLRELEPAIFDRDWQVAGELLGQSVGHFGPFHKATYNWHPGTGSWEYRKPDELSNALTRLGTSVDELTGLPEDIPRFLTPLSNNSANASRYDSRRWGWDFIEDRLSHLLNAANAKLNHLGLRYTPNAVPLKIWRVGKPEIEITERRLCKLFEIYHRSGEVYVTKRCLLTNWENIGISSSPSKNSISSANCKLNQKLSKLAVAVRIKPNSRRTDTAWRLEETAN